MESVKKSFMEINHEGHEEFWSARIKRKSTPNKTTNMRPRYLEKQNICEGNKEASLSSSDIEKSLLTFLDVIMVGFFWKEYLSFGDNYRFPKNKT